MSIESQSIYYLTHLTSRHIRFSLTLPSGVTAGVNHTTFDRVAGAIHRSAPPRIRIQQGQTATNTSAQYFSTPNRQLNVQEPNTILIPHLDNQFARISLLHEATHASLDLVKTNPLLSWLDEETLCYIVSFTAARVIGYDINFDNFNNNIGHEIGRSIASGSGISQTDFGNLRNQVTLLDAYRTHNQSGSQWAYPHDG